MRTFAEQANTGDVAHVRDPEFPLEAMEKVIADAVGEGNFAAVPATRVATALLGDSIATNLFMVGYAWQTGRIPLRAESILKAIEMNKAAVEMNKAAFLWGRRAAIDLAMVETVAVPREALPDSRILSATLDETLARRIADLTAYQSRRYARRYERLVQRAREAEAKVARDTRNSPMPSPAITTNSSPTRTNTRSRASTRRPISSSASRACSKATTSWY